MIPKAESRSDPSHANVAVHQQRHCMFSIDCSVASAISIAITWLNLNLASVAQSIVVQLLLWNCLIVGRPILCSPFSPSKCRSEEREKVSACQENLVSIHRPCDQYRDSKPYPDQRKELSSKSYGGKGLAMEFERNSGRERARWFITRIWEAREYFSDTSINTISIDNRNPMKIVYSTNDQ